MYIYIYIYIYIYAFPHGHVLYIYVQTDKDTYVHACTDRNINFVYIKALANRPASYIKALANRPASYILHTTYIFSNVSPEIGREGTCKCSSMSIP